MAHFPSSALGLPDLRPPAPGDTGDWTPPTDGWHLLVMELCRDADGKVEKRDAVYEGKIKPGKYEVRLRFTVADGGEKGTSWRRWMGWSLHPRSNFRPIIDAIRRNRPLDPNVPFDVVKHENKPFQAMIVVDERPDQQDPTRTMYFPDIVKVKPIGEATDEPEPAPAPPAVASNGVAPAGGGESPDPFADEADF